MVLLAVLLGQEFASAQLFRRNRNRVEPPRDTSTVVLPDSVIAYRDSVHRADSIARRDSLDMLGKSSLDRPAFSTAKDSIITELTDGQRKIYYYGGATVTYQDMTLTADYIEYDMKTNSVFARGRYDEATEEWVGQPEMTQGKATYKMEELHYNFDSQKASIFNMITQESEGLLQGKKIKMMPDRSINIRNGMYTVCDLEHPPSRPEVKILVGRLPADEWGGVHGVVFVYWLVCKRGLQAHDGISHRSRLIVQDERQEVERGMAAGRPKGATFVTEHRQRAFQGCTSYRQGRNQKKRGDLPRHWVDPPRACPVSTLYNMTSRM